LDRAIWGREVIRQVVVKEGIESSTPGLDKILDGAGNKAKAVRRNGGRRE